MLLKFKTKQILEFLFLFCFVLVLFSAAQTNVKQIEQAQNEFDNGNYKKALKLSEVEVEKAKDTKNTEATLRALDIQAISQISLEKYKEAEKSLNEALQILVNNGGKSLQTARIYLRFAWLLKSQRKFTQALEYCQKALSLASQNQEVEGECYLYIGRILFSSSYDISAIIWLEKAEKIFETKKVSPAKLDTYRFLHLAWFSRLNYQTSLRYAEKWVALAEKSPFKYKYRQALFEYATLLSATGQKALTYQTFEKGLKLSLYENNTYQACLFLTSLLLNSLDDDRLDKAQGYLDKLEKINADNLFTFEILLGKAIIFAYTNQLEKSDEVFAQLEKMESTSEFVIPYWKRTIAKKTKNWEQLIKVNQSLLELTEKDNYRDDLPGIYLNFAQGYFYLNQFQKSLESVEKSIAFVEEVRQTENTNLSLNLFETYHNAYRLLTQIKIKDPKESFELADFLKARLLKDKINNLAIINRLTVSPVVRQKLEYLSMKYLEDKSLASEIEKTEKLVTKTIPELKIDKLDLLELDKISSLQSTSIISYFFTLDEKLVAFVWQKGKPLEVKQLPITKEESDKLAAELPKKIKDSLFFKQEGKEIYDKLLKPLNLQAKHLIIIPDKSLWKIPFQALSEDGKTYLIENKTISYAPSVSILLNQLNNPTPNRQTFQVFSNALYNNLYLLYADAEANKLAKLFGVQPHLNSTVAAFAGLSDKSDIVHFSMHAEADNDEAFNSFLAFKPVGKDDGKLTVEELLKMKLKKGSLVFLASCDTNNVFNGEGLVSLAWGMMGAGASTVISAQWEANDKSTGQFTQAFYKYYKQGLSSAEAMQKASIEMIKSPNSQLNEPYYWAEFTLNGDYR